MSSQQRPNRGNGGSVGNPDKKTRQRIEELLRARGEALNVDAEFNDERDRRYAYKVKNRDWYTALHRPNAAVTSAAPSAAPPPSVAQSTPPAVSSTALPTPATASPVNNTTMPATLPRPSQESTQGTQFVVPAVPTAKVQIKMSQATEPRLSQIASQAATPANTEASDVPVTVAAAIRAMGGNEAETRRPFRELSERSKSPALSTSPQRSSGTPSRGSAPAATKPTPAVVPSGEPADVTTGHSSHNGPLDDGMDDYVLPPVDDYEYELPNAGDKDLDTDGNGIDGGSLDDEDDDDEEEEEGDDLGSDADPADIEARNARRQARFSGRDDRVRRTEAEILSTARIHEWDGQASLETALSRPLRSYFGGVGAELKSVETRTCPFDDTIRISLQRRDIISLQRGGWLEDGIVHSLVLSHFPNEILGNGVCVARGVDMQALMHCTEAQITTDEYAIPFELSEDVHTIAAHINERDMHWFVIRANRDTRIIEIYDSWVCDIAKEQRKRVARVEQRLLTIFNHYTDGPVWASQSWQDTANKWQCEWVTEIYRQRNCYDCGPLAVQNLVDVVRTGRVQVVHDANAIRRRSALRIGEVLDKILQWGEGDPQATEPVLPRSTQTGPLSGRQTYDEAMDDIDAGRGVIRPELIELSANVPRGPSVPYKDAFIALLHRSMPEGLTWRELLQRHLLVSMHMNTLMPPSWRSNFKKAVQTRKMEYATEDGTTGKLTLLNPNHTVPDLAFMAYGAGMDPHFQKAQAMRDDINKRPQLVVVPVRLSMMAQGNNRFATQNAREERETVAKTNLAHYLAVFNGRVEDPVAIRSTADMDLTNTTFWSHTYEMTRKSDSQVFKRDNGSPGEADIRMTDILDVVDSKAREDGVRADVVFVVFGVDGWFTGEENWELIATKYPDTDARITMAMPADRVTHVPHVFKPRPHDSQASQTIAWAHFDVRVVAEIASTWKADPKAPIQFQRADQAAILLMLDHVEEYKDILTLSGERDELYPDGKSLVSGLERNHLSGEVDKKCAQCGGQADQQWFRGPFDEADVICERCEAEPEVVDRAAKGKPPKKRQAPATAEELGDGEVVDRPAKARKGNKWPKSAFKHTRMVQRACARCRQRRKACDVDDLHPPPCTRCTKAGATCRPSEVGMQPSQAGRARPVTA